MLSTLIESGAARTRRPAASMLSVAVHAGLVTAAVLATKQIQSVTPSDAIPEVVYRVERTLTPPVIAPAVALIARGFSIVVAPVVIPDVLPPIDLTRPITNPADFTGVGVPGGRPDGTVGAPPGAAYTADQVERVAYIVAGTGTPLYPQALRTAGIEGDVVLEFVIDATGRADLGSVKVVSSNHKLFTDAAVRALGKARFVPAELGGQPVPQLVRMPMAFKLRT